MNKRFERTLSQILSIIILIVFVLTIVSMRSNMWIITYGWAVTFLIAWALMLIYALHVLLQKDSYGFSVFTAIITGLGFGLLSIPTILVLSRFVPQMPSGLSFGNQFLDANNQMIFYTSLIVIYVIHLLNSLKLKRSINESIELDDDEDNSEADRKELVEVNEKNSSPILVKEIDETYDNNLYDDNLKDENEEITDQNHKISSEDLKIGEKIVFESNNDEKLEYNTEKVIIVEDLTEDELKDLEGEDNNG